MLTSLHITEFDFQLPPELIAQRPATERDRSRMLILARDKKHYQDGQFQQLPQLLRAGDCLVLNNTRVFPARLQGQRAGFSAQVEIFLVRHQQGDQWEALVKPGRALRVGAQAIFGRNQDSNGIKAELLATILTALPNGRRIVEFTSQTAESVDQLIDRLGQTPLPPYIKRTDAESLRLDDTNYQTIYAQARGAIAAPTAGLHFTAEVLAAIKAQGVQVVELTHHVGYGTFQPVRVEKIDEHTIEAEHSIIDEATAQIINETKRARGRVIAVGTTTTRALESAAINDSSQIRAGQFTTELFIYPGYKFKVIDGLLTNFHLPKSSLLMLVAAFAEHSLVMAAYRHAVAQGYRFYSYGDCMFIY